MARTWSSNFCASPKEGDALDQSGDPASLIAVELVVLEVHVLTNLPDRRVGRARAGQQHLERAAVASVGELRLEHVEPQLARRRRGSLGWHEFEPGLRIDEAPDQPGRGDPVHVQTLARDPHPPLQGIHADVFRRIGFLAFVHRLILPRLAREIDERNLTVYLYEEIGKPISSDGFTGIVSVGHGSKREIVQPSQWPGNMLSGQALRPIPQIPLDLDPDLEHMTPLGSKGKRGSDDAASRERPDR